MPYTATSTVTRKYIHGREHVIITVEETLAANGSEFSIEELPVIGTIVQYKATKIAGTGTTINPKIGRSAAFVVSTQDHIASNSVTSSHINDNSIVKYYSPTGILYFRSTASDLTSDHTILTEIVIVNGSY